MGGGNSANTASGQRQKPPVEMPGRWQLAAPGRGQCAMIFAGAQGASEGTIAPEGGCPGMFYTSRKWNFEQEGLVIRDHNGEPLAQLSQAEGMRFDGKAKSGEPIMLTR